MKWIIISAILLAILIFSLVPFDGGDNVKYYMLSRSLRQGNYAEAWTPNNPTHTHFPIGLPALLMPAQNYTMSKIIIFIFYILSLFAYKCLLSTYTAIAESRYSIKGKRIKIDFRKTSLLKNNEYWLTINKNKNCSISQTPFPIPKSTAIMAMVLFAFSPKLIEYSHYVLSEIPFIFFSLMALIFAQKKKYIWALVFALVTFYTRVIGLTLLLAIAILPVLDRERFKFTGFLFFIPAGIYFIRTLIHSAGGSHYLSNMYFVAFLPNLRMATISAIGKLFGLVPISIMLFCIMLYGIWKYRNRNIEIYAGIYLLLMLVWRWGWDYRMYLPMLPIFAIWLAHGIYHISQRITKDNIILGWTAGLFILGNLSYTVSKAPTVWRDNRLWRVHQELPNDRKFIIMRSYLMVKKDIEERGVQEGQIFMVDKPAYFYFLTGKQAIELRRDNDNTR